MVYKIANTRSDFIFSGVMPEDNIEYSRKGGCFVSICRGISIAVLLFVFIFFLSFTIFFATKYAYELKPNVTLEEFLNHRAYLIDKHPTIARHIIPKHYRLFIHPRFNENDNGFIYNGIVWITITSKKHNTRRIELNGKNLNVRLEDVSVYRSITLTNLDFDDDLDWDLSNENVKTSSSRKKKRSTEPDHSEVMSPHEEQKLTTAAATSLEQEEPPEEPSEERTTPNNAEEAENNAGEVTDINGAGTTILSAAEESFSSDDPESKTYIAHVAHFNITDLPKKYHHPMLSGDDDFVPIRVTDLEFDEPNDKIFIYLGTEMKKDMYYIVRVNFTGYMTNNKGLFYTAYEDTDGEMGHFAATFLEPNNARELFPCLDDHNFRAPFDIDIAHRHDMNTISVSTLLNSVSFDDDWIVDNYLTTSSIRASEIGFIITDMAMEESAIIRNITLQLYNRKRLNTTFQDSLMELPNILNCYETYLEMEFPYQKIKYIAVPNVDINFREIKNGMVLTSEQNMLVEINNYDEIHNMPSEHVALDLARLWIHNLVDYKNKEQYWLHETIPIYLQYLFIRDDADHIQRIDDKFLESRLMAMKEDYILKSTALTLFYENWNNADFHVYIKNKGINVLRMFEATLGKSTIDHFIKQFFYERTQNETYDFIEYIEGMNKINSSMLSEDFEILDYVTSWTNIEKYPVIEVTTNHTNGNGSVIFRQVIIPTDEEVTNAPPYVPIFIHNSSHNKDKFKTLWITGDENYTKFENVITTTGDDAFIVVNPYGIGYYRVNYDCDNWKRIRNALNTNHTVIPYITRAILIDDALNLAQFGILNYTFVFDILNYMKDHEISYYPWKAALDNFDCLYNTIEDLPNYLKIETYLINTIRTTYNRLSFTENNREQELLKLLLIKWMCRLSFSDCINDKRKEFDVLVKSGDWEFTIKPDTELIFCTTVKFSGFHEWDMVLHMAKNTTDIILKKILIKSLGCARQINLIKKYFDLLKNPQFKDYTTVILESLSQNKIGLKYSLDFLRNDWTEIQEFLDLQDLSILFFKISNDNEYEMFRDIFFSYSGTFKQTDKELLKKIRENILKILHWRNTVAKYI